jgi:EAL domain-containing protein (putative c-di-GMP-specific phosphodiesterase class I)/CheY-like chemotaxis protein
MPGPDTQALRILAIDDEPFQLRLLRSQLAALGLTQLDTCGDAQEALLRIGEGPAQWGLICCDLQMPGMDGVEFIRHLGKTGYTGALALISGEDPRTVSTAQRLGSSHGLRVVGALSKPVAPARLREVVQAALQPARGAAAPGRSYGADELAAGIAAGQLVLHYQPKVDMASGLLSGVETLVRWQHPQDGLVPPDRFVALAEEHGLIDALTTEVLAGEQGALRQARRWQEQGLTVPVSVNVSMDNLTDHRFPDFVAQALARHGVPPARLTLEVTESRLGSDPVATLDILARLRLKRVGLSIDDFGTGHSSLVQLRDLPFDELKIDRSFVHPAHRDERLAAIVKASMEMAARLGIASVAEGVEDLDDWRFMRRCGCAVAQGWFIARPMPGAALPGWAAEWEARRGRVLAESA